MNVVLRCVSAVFVVACFAKLAGAEPDPQAGSSAPVVRSFSVKGPGKLQTVNSTFAPITVGASSSPYPASLTVSGMTGTVARVRLKLQVSHTYLNDVTMLLEGPTGQKVVVFGNLFDFDGTGYVASSENYIIQSDAAETLKGAFGGIFSVPASSGSFSFPPPAPLGPHSTTLTSFNGTNPNGDWKLYVHDLVPSTDNGTIEKAELEIETEFCTINSGDNSAGSPYPFEIPVSGWTGSLSHIQVRLENLQHTFPSDLSVLLVSPSGEKVLLMQNTGASFSINARDLAFQDSGTPLPLSAEILSGTYKPTSYGPQLSLPLPAPLGPYSTSLATFASSTVNGTWKVFVSDSASFFTGCIEGVTLDIVAPGTGQSVYLTTNNFMNSSDITPPGSSTGWSNIGLTAATYVNPGGFNNPYFQFPIAAHPTKTRISGIVRNKDGWPSFGTPDFDWAGEARVYATGLANPTDYNLIPNMRIRVQQRFAYNSMLEVFHHTGDTPTQTAMDQELRPTTLTDGNLSTYWVPMIRSEVPRSRLTGEGLQFGFEAYSTLPQDAATLRAEILALWALPSFMESKTAAPVKTFAPTTSNAGTLAVFTPDAELQNFALNFGAAAGDPPTVAVGVLGGTYVENSTGVTLSTVGQATTPPVRAVVRNFNPESGGTSYFPRLRVAENTYHIARFHVTSTRASFLQSQLRFRARSIKFAWSQKLEIGGARAAGSINNKLANQLLPGFSTLNDAQRTVGERGGYYYVKMITPMQRGIRPEFSSGTPISTRMPNISAQPAEGVASASRRDIFFGADVLDTLSTATGFEQEAGQMTIDEIAVMTGPTSKLYTFNQ